MWRKKEPRNSPCLNRVCRSRACWAMHLLLIPEHGVNVVTYSITSQQTSLTVHCKTNTQDTVPNPTFKIGVKKNGQTISQFNSRHKKSEPLVEVVQSNRQSIPPRIKPNREQGTVHEPHALPFLLDLFRHVVWEDQARFVPDVWIRRLGTCCSYTSSSSSERLRIVRISCPTNSNCQPFLFTMDPEVFRLPSEMSGCQTMSGAVKSKFRDLFLSVPHG